MCAKPLLSVSTPKSSNSWRPVVHVAPASQTAPPWTGISCCGAPQPVAVLVVFWTKLPDQVWFVLVAAPEYTRPTPPHPPATPATLPCADPVLPAPDHSH